MANFLSISPLTHYFDPSDFLVDQKLSENLCVCKLRRAHCSNEALLALDASQRELFSEGALAFVLETEADSLTPEMLSAVYDKMLLAYLSLWIVRPTSIRMRGIHTFRMEPGNIVLRNSTVETFYLVDETETTNCFGGDDIETVRVFLPKLCKLSRDSTVWLAVRTLHRALTEREWSLRFLLQWLVLECLFGPENPGETTFRLTQRMGLYFGKTAESAAGIKQAAKNSYGWRSKIVHGKQLQKLTREKSADLSRELEGWVRDVFTNILTSDAEQENFESGRDLFLDNLVYNPRF